MIVKNEQSVLGRCLESIGGVADQIVVVDTGSTDDTAKIASAHGAEVYEYAWHDDFAAARNHSIAFARHRWILWLDADDVVPQQSHEALHTVKKLPADRVLGFTVRNQKPGNTGSEFVQARLFPNDSRLRFEGRIHEQIMPSALKAGMTMEKRSVVIEHHGYADPQQLKQKARRNLEYLLEDFDSNSPEPVSIVEIADSYTILGDDENAARWYQQLLNITAVKEHSPFLATQALMGLGNRANRRGAYEEALGYFDQALRLYPERPDVLFGRAVSLEMTGQLDQAIRTFGHIPQISRVPVQVGIDFRLTAVKACLRLFRLLWEKKDIAGLNRLIEDAQATAGERPDIKNACATALIQLNRLMEALHLFEDSLKIVQRGNIDAYIGLCVIYRIAGKHPLVTQTLQSIEPLFEQTPRYWAARVFLTQLSADDIPRKIPRHTLEDEIEHLQKTYPMGNAKPHH